MVASSNSSSSVRSQCCLKNQYIVWTLTLHSTTITTTTTTNNAIDRPTAPHCDPTCHPRREPFRKCSLQTFTNVQLGCSVASPFSSGSHRQSVLLLSGSSSYLMSFTLPAGLPNPSCDLASPTCSFLRGRHFFLQIQSVLSNAAIERFVL